MKFCSAHGLQEEEEQHLASIPIVSPVLRPALAAGRSLYTHYYICVA